VFEVEVNEAFTHSTYDASKNRWPFLSYAGLSMARHYPE
jgi:hypothetical protein